MDKLKPSTTWATTGRCEKHNEYYSIPDGRCEKCSRDLTIPTPGVTKIVVHQAPDEESKRYNVGKVQLREVDPSFILGLGEVLTKSRAKYDEMNWAKPTKLSTPYESMMRHILAFQSGEDLDKETQSHHLLHAATNLMFMYYHITNNPEESDDRCFKKRKK
jgi:hypothetical protein